MLIKIGYMHPLIVSPSIFQQEIDFFSSGVILAVLWGKHWYYWVVKDWHINQES